jgi:hypothetical protein
VPSAIGECERDSVEAEIDAAAFPLSAEALDALPLTQNGKVDRKVLPPPTLEVVASEAAYVPPRGPEEEMLAGIWADVLGVPRVGIEDDFFALGGHSLLAAQMVARLRNITGRQLSLAVVFEKPTIAALAETLAVTATEVAHSGPQPGATEGVALPLSFPQERLWFIEQLAPVFLSFVVLLN